MDPEMGHMTNADPADNLAIFQACRPDQLYLPSGRGSGFPHTPGPGGAGAGGPLPPNIDNKLFGQSPNIFTGDKGKAQEFITQWDLYWSPNYNVAMMIMPHTHAMLFLTFFKGPLRANWTSVMKQHFNTQV